MYFAFAKVKNEISQQNKEIKPNYTVQLLSNRYTGDIGDTTFNFKQNLTAL